MSFGLLAPALLGFALLAIGPVLAHLTRQEPREKRAFGAMLLLDRILKNPRRRRRLRDLLLLLLRILVVLAGVLAVAQPELRVPVETGEIGGTGRVVVVLDDSLSMDQQVGAASAFVGARKQASELVRGLPAGAEVAVVLAGVPVRAVTGLSGDHPSVAALIEGQAQRPVATDLHAALTEARRILEGQPGEVVVYTDESGPGVVAACAIDLERLMATGGRLIPRPVAPELPANIVPTEASYGDGLEGGSVVVRLVNHGPEAVEVPTTVELPDGTAITSFVNVEAATEAGPASAEASFTVPRQAQGGVASVRVNDPKLPLDNARYFHLPEVGNSRVLLVDGDPGSTPTRSEVYFLERALAPYGTGGVTVDVVAPGGLATLDSGPYRVAWLANVSDPGPWAPLLVEFVRKGGGLVLSAGDNVTAERWNSALVSLLPAVLGRPRDLVSLDATEGEPLSVPDSAIDVFAPFLNGGLDAFTRIRQRRVMTTAPYEDNEEVRTLLRFQSGVPALVERKVGTGRVLFWASTLDLGWGNAPLQAAFAPLALRLTGWLGGEVGGGARRATTEVGETVTVPLPEGIIDVEVRGPDGTVVPATRSAEAIAFTPEVAGAFAVGVAGEAPRAWVAVNTAPLESDVRRPLALDAVSAEVDPARSARRIPLGPWAWTFGAGALVLVALFARGRQETT